MMLSASQPIAEWRQVDERTFREEIVSRHRPAVLRGLVSDWPAVKAARRSAADVAGYLARLDNGGAVDAILMPPGARGRISYNAAMDGFNFARKRLPLSAILEQLARYAHFEDPPSVAVQSAPVPGCLPGFAAENAMPILDAAVVPRIWVGNRVTVPAHFDESCNLACVVAGRRRFTLFPPEQVGNLYIGPLDFAPTGAAMSLAPLDDPDLERFPRLRTALSAALSAELDPGDALFIPTLWWHHVESLDPKLNVLVNFWWHGALGAVERSPSAMDGLLHCLLNIKPLSPELRDAWRQLFEHYVFGAEDDRFAHIPPPRLGVLGAMTPESAARVRSMLIANLKRDSAQAS